MSQRSAPAKPSATLKDVAKLAGVSTAVVSYVVNGGPKNVSPLSEAKVREAIRMLGYRPNAAARALRSGSAEMLGIVVPDITNPFFASLAHAVEEAAAARGYALTIANSGHSLAVERRLVENLASRRVDGVFLCSIVAEPDLRDLESAEIPAVLLSYTGEESDHCSVGVGLEDGGRLAVEHLIGHGHGDIGLIMGSLVGGVLDGRETGWRAALEDAGLRPGPIMRIPFTREGGYQAGEWFLNATSRPSAVFVSSDLQAVGFLRALHDSGVQVPSDLAVVSFDGSKEAEYSIPRLTTVAQPVEEMALAAVEALLGNGGPQHSRTFPVTLIRRASCGCVSER
nr:MULTISPECIES: LacI family DNA-binding transcriptional regulator [Arthrobacter]